MTPGRARTLCWSAGIVLFAAAGIALTWGFAAPLEEFASTGRENKRPQAAKPQPLSAPPLAQFQSLFRKRLRQELQETNAAATQTPVNPVKIKPATALGMKLVGTILETGQSMAVFQATSGRVEFRRVGEFVGEQTQRAEVLAIEPDRVEVRYQGEKLMFELKPKES